MQPAACNSTTCHSTVQRSSTEYDLDRPYTIIGDHFQLIVYDPRSIGDDFQFQDLVHSDDRLFWNMIVEKRWIVVLDGPDWTEGGPTVDRGRMVMGGRLWLFWGRCKNVSCSTD